MNKVPKEVIAIAKEIDVMFGEFFPRIFSVDFGYTEKGPRIFELNSQPGLPGPNCPKYYRRWQKALLKTLLSGLKKVKSSSSS